MKKQPEQMPEDQRFHDTYLLLKKYRDVVWGLELSVQQVKRRFQMEVGSSIKDFLDSIYLAGVDFSDNGIEEQARSIEKSYQMLKLLETSVNIMRNKHKHGEMYYWLLYYPFTAYELSDDNGILLGVNKYNNSLVIVDIFNSAVYKNANIAIMGTSGAGKTFTLQLMALRMRQKGTQVFIIAPLKGHEFLRACRNTGGEFIQISPASKNCINVMEIRKTDRSVDELLDGAPIEKSELAAKIQQLHIFFSLLIPDITHEERQLLDEALIKTYNTKGITHDNDTLTDPDDPDRYREMPILGDLYDILITAPETKRLANILNRLVHGSASTFNQRTNVNLDNKYTVLDISELSGDLLTAGMFVALDYVWDKAKQNRTVEKTIPVLPASVLKQSNGRSRACPVRRSPKCTGSSRILWVRGYPEQPDG